MSAPSPLPALWMSAKLRPTRNVPFAAVRELAGSQSTAADSEDLFSLLEADCVLEMDKISSEHGAPIHHDIWEEAFEDMYKCSNHANYYTDSITLKQNCTNLQKCLPYVFRSNLKP